MYDAPNFLFYLVWFYIHNVVYLGGFKGTIKAHHVKIKFRPHLRDVANFRLFSAFPLPKFFYTTRRWKSMARLWFSVA